VLRSSSELDLGGRSKVCVAPADGPAPLSFRDFFRGGGFSEARFLQVNRWTRLCFSSLGEAGATRGALCALQDARDARSIANQPLAPGCSKTSIYFTGPLVPRGGGVSNSGEMRTRTGGLAKRIFQRNSKNFFAAAAQPIERKPDADQT
jgi:hypothetical protein